MYSRISSSIFFFALVTSLSAQWTSRFNGQGDYSDVFNATVVASDGAIYAAGYTINPDISKDILLVKFNNSGDTLWTRQFAGTGNGPDEALDMAMDADGHILLTGYQKGDGTGFDFITLQYDADGNLLWTAIYNYSTNETDQSNVITVDNAGNIYIAGQSDKDNSPLNDDDFVIVKYNNAGVQQWAKRSDGFGNATDRPAAIAVTTDGNLVVTGRSFNGNDDDYMTIKYNSSTGAEMWRKYFDRTHNDRATSIAVDAASGKIVVTGRSNNANDYDFVTICYNTSGVEQWNQVYDFVDDDRATHVAIDNSSNVYVAGNSDVNAGVNVNYNITLVKYNINGVQQYAQSFEGPAANDDIPTDLFVDGSGNATVTGTADTDPSSAVTNDIVALRYDNFGTLQWSAQSGTATNNDVPDAIAVKNDGTVYIAGFQESIPERDAALIKITNAGSIAWVGTFNGIGDNGDNMHAIVRDGMNNSIVAGYTTAYAADRNFLVMKLGADGDVVWTKTFNGSSTKQSTDDALAVTTDNANNIYAAGFVKNSGTGYDMLIVKLSNTGDSIWAYTYNDAASNETDKAIAIYVDASGNTTILGRSDADATVTSNDDILVIRLNASGVQQWISRFNGSGNGDDFPRQMIVTPGGDIYVAGESFNGTDMDAVLIKYNASGVKQWSKVYDGGNGDDEFISIKADAAENIYAAGHTTSNTADLDALLVVYNASGAKLDEGQFDGGTHGHDITKGATLNAEGLPILSITSEGDTDPLTLDGDIQIVCFNTDASFNWNTTYDGGANDDASDITFDAINGVVVCGQTDQSTGAELNYDYITLYIGDAEISSTELYEGTGAASDVANTLMGHSNGVYVSGGSASETGQRDIVTILYGTTPDAIQYLNGTNELIAYPNPTNSMCQISYALNNINASIQIIDMYGRTCDAPYFLTANGISVDLTEFPSGLYTISIESDKIIKTATCIKL